MTITTFKVKVLTNDNKDLTLELNSAELDVFAKIANEQGHKIVEIKRIDKEMRTYF